MVAFLKRVMLVFGAPLYGILYVLSLFATVLGISYICTGDGLKFMDWILDLPSRALEWAKHEKKSPKL